MLRVLPSLTFNFTAPTCNFPFSYELKLETVWNNTRMAVQTRKEQRASMFTLKVTLARSVLVAHVARVVQATMRCQASAPNCLRRFAAMEQ